MGRLAQQTQAHKVDPAVTVVEAGRIGKSIYHPSYGKRLPALWWNSRIPHLKCHRKIVEGRTPPQSLRCHKDVNPESESNETLEIKRITPPRTTVVQRGFAGRKIDTKGVFSSKIPCYPPPSNAYYQHSMYSIASHHAMTFAPAIDSTLPMQQSIAHNAQVQEDRVEIPQPNIGEIEAEKIDWDRATYSDEGLIFGDIALSRDEFVKMINDNISQGRWPFDMCTVCSKQHIPWGPPIHLQDRDTCYSMLPEWFPAKDFDKPWDALRGLINCIVKLGEREKNRLASPDKKKWELEYHEPSREWKALGRIGGWWKCGSGSNAPMAERTCKLCHRPRTAEEQSKENAPAREKLLLNVATKWIEELGLRQMEKDIRVCDERYLRQGHY